MKTIIHVNQHNIKHNIKSENKKPVLTVKNYKENKYCNKVIIHGASEIIYSPEKPLSCGARVWIETKADVELIEELDSKELFCKLKSVDKKSKRI